MLDLALHDGSGPVSLAGISDRQKISLAYLEQLFVKLRRHGLVESVRGPSGGYMLSRHPTQVSVVEVILAVNESIDATQCGGKENCNDDHRCMTHDLWARLNARMVDFLSSITLGDLVEQQRSRPVQLIGMKGTTGAKRQKPALLA